MDQPDHLAHLAEETGAVAQVLRSGDLAAAVPYCPGWTLRELGLHLGGVHRWVSQVVETGRRQDQPAVEVDDGELAGWYAESAAVLVRQLTDADPDRECWTLAGPGTVAFWRRRQALETVVHRVDAERSVGAERPLAEDLAEDGVAEVVDVLHPRQVRLGRAAPPEHSLRLVATGGRAWQLGTGPIGATVSGPASSLLMLLWRRTTAADPALVVTGDRAYLDAQLAQALTP